MKTYHGSCHCGAVRFTADLDLSKGTMRCNCSYCRKARNWIVPTTPDHVTITAGQEAIASFTGPLGGNYAFCKHCGIRLWTEGDIPDYPRFWNLFVPTLDDASPDELTSGPIEWLDMANDHWDRAPARVDHL